MSTPYRLHLRLEGLPKVLTNERLHHFKKAKEVKYWRTAVAVAVGNKRPPQPLERARISYRRCGSVYLDGDNLATSFKAVQDGLVDAGVIVNDRWENIGMPHYDQEKVPRKETCIEIDVEELPLAA